jgi:Tfp pilus assembly protein PilO
MFKALHRRVSLPPAAAHGCGAAITLVLAALLYRGVYAPMHEEIRDRSLRIARVSKLHAQSDAISLEHRTVKSRLAALTKAAAQTRTRMPSEHSAGEFVEQATRLAGELGLEVEQCQTGPPQTHAQHATIEVSCRLVGSFASICRFFAAIDQLPQIAKVWRLDLNGATASAGYPVQVTFQLYYQVDPLDKDSQGGTL